MSGKFIVSIDYSRNWYVFPIEIASNFNSAILNNENVPDSAKIIGNKLRNLEFSLEDYGDKYFSFVQDNDYHWFIIPSDKKNNWHDDMMKMYNNGGVPPKYSDMIGTHPSNIPFNKFVIKNH